MATATSEMDTQEQARRAVIAFRRELPLMQAFVRAIGRDDRLRVEIVAKGPPRTDGKVVKMPVPIELGEAVEHVRSLCDRRDDDGVLICPKCALREEVFTTLFHETAHMLHGSFETPDLETVRRVVEGFYGAGSGTRAAKLVDRISKALNSGEEVNCMGVATKLSPYLPILVNAIEDIRVNGEVVRRRKGTAKMFRAWNVMALRQSQWHLAPPNAQACISVYLLAIGGRGLLHYLHPDVAERLDDDELTRLSKQAVKMDSASEAFRLSLAVLERLRELGFLRDPEDPEDEPEPEPDDEDTDGDDDEESDDSESDDSDESQDSDDDDADGESQGKPCDDGEDSDDTTDDDTEGDDEGDGGDADDSEEEDASSGSESDDESDGDDGSDSEDGDADGDDDEPATEVDDGEGDADGDDDTPAEGDDDADDGADDGEAEGDADTDADDGDSSDDDDAGDAEGDPGDDDAEGDSTDGADGDEDASDGDPDAESDRTDGDGDGEQEPYTEQQQEEDGTPDKVREALEKFAGHPEDGPEPPDFDDDVPTNQAEREVTLAIGQVEYFDNPSANVPTVRVLRESDGDRQSPWWNGERFPEEMRPLNVDSSILTASTLSARRTFTANRRGKVERNLRRGTSVDPKKLGRRIPTGDDRIFAKRAHPGRKSYFVLIGLDVSGSTSIYGNNRIHDMKDMVAMQADMLAKLNIPFAVYAHSGGGISNGYGSNSLDIFVVKEPNEPWGTEQRGTLERLYSYAVNLDGHTFEYYRKVLETRRETERILLYYTDGAMPAENFHEELAILQTEIKNLDRMGCHVLGVGCGTDSPTKHGLETVRFDSQADTRKVLEALRAKLT